MNEIKRLYTEANMEIDGIVQRSQVAKSNIISKVINDKLVRFQKEAQSETTKTIQIKVISITEDKINNGDYYSIVIFVEIEKIS